MNIPKDPVMLLSFINTQLRDFYPSLKDFCAANNIDIKSICDTLASIDYEYDAQTNRFI